MFGIQSIEYLYIQTADFTLNTKNCEVYSMVKENISEENVEENTEERNGDGYVEIKMGGGWYMTISLAHSDRFEKEYVELAKERGGVKKSRFNLNPTHVRMLGEALIKFADDNGL
jgi:hypothetical protein